MFRYEDTLRIETEQLIGPFRYLPVVDAACELTDNDGPSCIGRTVRQALDGFQLVHPDAHEPCLWNPGQEAATLKQYGVADNLLSQVRYLGVERPFINPAVAADSRYLVVTHHENLFELWSGVTVAGEFHERYWPHISLADVATDEELGRAVLDALERCTLKKR